MALATVGIGSNVGDAAATVHRAFERLGALGTVVARSSLYRTAPWGVLEQEPFVNAVAVLDTPLAPRALLTALQALEVDAGRVATFRWGPRVLDLDILLYDDARVNEPDLVIPHPRLRERAFVLIPLAQVDDRFAADRDALAPGERAGVVELAPR